MFPVHLSRDSSSLTHSLSQRSWKMPMRNNDLTTAFIVLQIIGWVGYTLIVWTVAFAKSIERHHTWINFCLCWLLSCVSYVLLFLAGQQNNPHPTYQLCLIQASLVYAAPSLTATATLSLVLQLWFNVRSIVFKAQSNHQPLRNVVLFTLPYVPATVFFTTVLVYGIQHPLEVQPADHGMYCNIVPSFPGKASAIYVMLTLAATIGIEFVIATVLYRNWTSYTRSKRHSFAMIIRVVLFTIMGGLTITVNLIYIMHTKHGAVPNIFIAILPVISVIIFGSQLDIFRVWMFWRRQSQEPWPVSKNAHLRPLLTQSQSSLSSAVSMESTLSDESFEPQMRSGTFDTLSTLMQNHTAPLPIAARHDRSGSVANPLLQPPTTSRGSAPAAFGRGLRRDRSPSESSDRVPLRSSTF